MFCIYLFRSTFAPDYFLISQCFFYFLEPLSYILLPLFCLFSYPSQSFSYFSPFRFFSSNDWHSTFLLFLAYFFSIGNVVDPLSVIEGGGNQKENPAYGADTLRLWVSGECFYLNFCPPFFSTAYWYMVLYLSFVYLFLSLQTLTHTLYKSSLLSPSLTHLLIQSPTAFFTHSHAPYVCLISGVDYSTDVCLGDGIIKQVSESYRKLRNTLRYLLGESVYTL